MRFERDLSMVTTTHWILPKRAKVVDVESSNNEWTAGRPCLGISAQ